MPAKKPIIPLEEVTELTDEELLRFGNRIVAMSMIPTIWRMKTGETYDRSAALHARLVGRIVPMGRYKNRLYFWIHEVEAAVPIDQPKRGPKPGRKKSDELPEQGAIHQNLVNSPQ